MFWAAVVVIGVVTFIGIVAYFILAFENLFSGISVFFVKPELTSKEEYDRSNYEKDGIATDSKYSYVKKDCDLDNYKESKCLCDPEEEDCKQLSHEEMVKVLKKDDRCHIGSGFLEFMDKLSLGFSGDKFTNECQLLRMINALISYYEDKYSDYDLKLDRGLVLSTIISIYGNQSTETDEEDKVETVNHYEIIKNLISERTLKASDVTDIVKYTMLEEVYPYYKYEDGSCKLYTYKGIKYSLEKWELYMRYGYDNSQLGVSSSEYSLPGYLELNGTKILGTDFSGDDYTALSGTGWVYSKTLNKAWSQTSEECRGESFFTDRNMTGLIDLSPYEQKMNDIFNTEKETLSSATLIDNFDTIDVKFDYRAGFAYNNYKEFKSAIDNGDNKYDETLTPKRIEQEIQNTIDRKTHLNTSMYYDDNKSYYFKMLTVPAESDLYFWPIGSDKVEQINGIDFAIDTPARTNISSEYGERTLRGKKNMHYGIDIPGAEGKTNVIAAKGGKVIKVYNNCIPGNLECGGKSGNHIKIAHEDGTITLYAHLHKDTILVKENDEVFQGQVIAKLGNTGNSTGPHLHFGVQVNSKTYVDPLNYVDPKDPRPKSLVEIKLKRGTDNKSTMCQTLLNSGISENATSALMVNAMADSDFDPTKDINYSDGTNSYGLFQWKGNNKINELKGYCEKKGLGYDSIEGQLSYLLYSSYFSSSNGKNAYRTLVSKDIPRNIANNFCILYEDLKDAEAECNKRVDNYLDDMIRYVKNGCKE